MKKIFVLFMVIVLGFGLAACKGTPTDPGTDPTSPTGTIELTYADWGDQEFNKRLIDAFMVKYPNIRVTLRSDISGSGATFTGNLITAAQAGLLPDVFAIDNVPVGINNGLALDVASLWDADPDTALVYDNIAFTGVYNGKRYAVPSFQFLKGIMINLDIFESANLNTVPGQYRIDNDGYPVKDWTHEEFVNIAKAIKNFDLDNTENLVVGLDTWYGSPDFQQVWPMMNDADVQYDTWDGTQFNYTSADWIYAMQEKVALHQLTDGTTTRVTPEVYENNPVLQQYLINAGYGAMDIEGSWQFWVVNDAASRDINIGFWPYPSGSAGLFPPTILDYQMVSSQTDHPAEAFLLAKWMTFGKDGWNARLDMLEADRNAALAEGEIPRFLDRFPVANYPGVWDRVYALVDGIEGIEYTLNRIEHSKPDLDKWLPGYNLFWDWVYNPENQYNWDNLVEAGPTAVATYAVQWQNAANGFVQDELENLGSDN
ncbi:ABC transporter substrate-binding protein [Peloplasma aerotolerans]|uniref:ABC transporter substrate-binding protein n=1 Tax=Peloplasma aerotolerans TaxID=3044389 RepID=A0AAW6U8A5_9MOLU|nr:ABC transporter substrate-binding protein [Mariniplasma sp. M4Ah]MDI6453160.1 ABC transporter substrate-binding protein [Mariniplasma sp. M4Ah]MDR4968703.1 ABC transporter substrate-binding protein [Acholeplasmataceae bacterium]